MLNILVVECDLTKAFWFLLTSSNSLGAKRSDSIFEMSFAKLRIIVIGL
jgi:hypothetical protein